MLRGTADKWVEYCKETLADTQEHTILDTPSESDDKLREKMNRARRVQFSPHETATQEVLFPTFLHLTVLRPELPLLFAQYPSSIQKPGKCCHTFELYKAWQVKHLYKCTWNVAKFEGVFYTSVHLEKPHLQVPAPIFFQELLSHKILEKKDVGTVRQHISYSYTGSPVYELTVVLTLRYRPLLLTRDDKIIDKPETNLMALRRTICRTIHSSTGVEQCAHRLMKIKKSGQEMFNEGTVSDLAHNIIVFIFSPHIKQMEGDCILLPISDIMDANVGTYTAFFMYPQEIS
ncbi:Pre-mRNA-splicing factor CWC22-like protein [Zootermopsis nevadensis]|uniref:Pre-mRNA-splicing factor CWC22-like protein n=1 Tax=Zootermopsis nevadensis TaxID=136037 RepID=A0A067RFK8_ZOONE|nr:Pre-mRNA-splicing factor CWC22-like protein [Zootermopsis nevadensis]